MLSLVTSQTGGPVIEGIGSGHNGALSRPDAQFRMLFQVHQKYVGSDSASRGRRCRGSGRPLKPRGQRSHQASRLSRQAARKLGCSREYGRTERGPDKRDRTGINKLKDARSIKYDRRTPDGLSRQGCQSA